MTAWLALIPFVSAFVGWCINRIAIELFFRRMFRGSGRVASAYRLEMAQRLGTVLARAFSPDDLQQKVMDPGNLQKIMPEIENHIDDFLRVKLPLAMPVVGMFVGDKTIGQMKAVFLAELQTLFPQIMKTYIQQLRNDIDVPSIIVQKLATYPNERLRHLAWETLSREIRMAGILGAISGGVTGIIQVIVLLILRV